MSRHRILVVGAPASGKAWLAGRIHALTGMAVSDEAAGPRELAGKHEWIVVARSLEHCRQVAAHADLVVLVRTPRLLREARLLLRWCSSWGRPGLRGLHEALRETHRWEADEVPALRALLQPIRQQVLHCGSPDEVRAVLECVLGITPAPGARS